MRFNESYEFIKQMKLHTNDKIYFAYIETFGCAQNISDSEKIKGILLTCGYTITSDASLADIIMLNTCAVRDTAEKKALGRLGAFKNFKVLNKHLKIGFCGCMAGQKSVVDDIIKKYKFVDFIFPPSKIPYLPEILCNVMDGKTVIEDDAQSLEITEDVPLLRESKINASITIMYGCNNFCSYCIVPYTRGRERSRSKSEIIQEVKDLVASGYKEITLLGQNVNSYGKDLKEDTDISDLLFEIDKIHGEFIVRFLTSHPKDMSVKLMDTIANSSKIASHIHLPVQSGSDVVLEKMNRKYTTSEYLKLIEYARAKILNVTFSSDIIVGFPEETAVDFDETLELVSKVRFDTLYTFLYSKRKGTPAFENVNQISYEDKTLRFNKLIKLQNKIAKEINESLVGSIQSVLVQGTSKKNSELLSARTTSNKVVLFAGDISLIGKFILVKITSCNTFSLFADVL